MTRRPRPGRSGRTPWRSDRGSVRPVQRRPEPLRLVVGADERGAGGPGVGHQVGDVVSMAGDVTPAAVGMPDSTSTMRRPSTSRCSTPRIIRRPRRRAATSGSTARRVPVSWLPGSIHRDRDRGEQRERLVPVPVERLVAHVALDHDRRGPQASGAAQGVAPCPGRPPGSKVSSRSVLRLSSAQVQVVEGGEAGTALARQAAACGTPAGRPSVRPRCGPSPGVDARVSLASSHATGPLVIDRERSTRRGPSTDGEPARLQRRAHGLGRAVLDRTHPGRSPRSGAGDVLRRCGTVAAGRGRSGHGSGCRVGTRERRQPERSRCAAATLTAIRSRCWASTREPLAAGARRRTRRRRPRGPRR